MLHKSRFTLLLFLLVGGLAWAAPVSITSHKEGDAIGASMLLKGKCDKKAEGHLWVFGRIKHVDNQWWPMPKAYINKQGIWSVTVSVGEQQDVGRGYEVAVGFFDDATNTRLEKYFVDARNSGHWPHMPLPTSLSGTVKLNLKKTSHY